MSNDLYERRGVSADKGDVFAAIRNMDAGLVPDAFCRVLPDLLGGSPDHANLLHTDTAGTKPVLSYLHWRETGELDVWDKIAQDALVMNLDDMACSGVLDNFLISSNIARNKRLIPAEVLARLIPAAEVFCQRLRAFGIRAALAGGETADVGDLVRTIDVGYTVAARLPRNEVLAVRPQPGDVILGLASFGQASYEEAPNSGIGCNGLTSARHDLLQASYGEEFPESFDPGLPADVRFQGRYRLTDPVDTPAGTQRIGDLLLAPTRTYLPLLARVIPAHRPHIHGIVHCTGGGQTKCLHFGQNVHYIKDNLFPPPLIFRLIQAAMPTPWREMFRSFNCGHRLECYTDEATAAAIAAEAQKLGIESRIVGRIESADGPPRLSLHHEGEVFTYEAEAIA